MSTTFTKLFSSITESTVWQEAPSTRLVWITMLAMSDRLGRVWASIPGLAHRARVSIKDTRTAIATLLAPDPDSRTPDHEGRRIEAIDGGWRLLNYLKYRAIKDEESIKESKRKYINARRAKESKTVDTSRTQAKQSRHIAEAEAEAVQTPIPPEGVGGGVSTESAKLRFGALFHRKPTTPWTEKELKALKKLEPISEEDLAMIENYYTEKIPPESDFRRRDLQTLLNNFRGEVDRAYGRKMQPPVNREDLQNELSELRFEVECTSGKGEPVPAHIPARIKEIVHQLNTK